MYLGRYSIEKLLAFEEYQRETSRSRTFAVIALTPMPALLIVLILATIPLQSPLLPATSNSAYFVQSALSFSVVTFGMLLYMRCAVQLPQNVYSHRECALISFLTAGANELLMVIVSVTWRFPIPLRDILGAPSYIFFLVLFHAVVLRTKLHHYRNRIREYLPLCAAQLSAFFLFEGVAILFMFAPVWGKVVISVAFPLLRTMLKHTIRRFAHSLEDISTEVSLCVVEIFGSLFQNVCLQSSGSLLVSGLIILVDTAQAIVEVRVYLDHKFVVDGRHCVRTAVKVIQSALFPGAVSPNKRRKSSSKLEGIGAMKPSRRGVSLALAATDGFTETKNQNARPSQRTSKVACLAKGSSEVLDVGFIQLGVLDQELLSSKSTLNQDPGNLRTRPSSIDDVDITHRHHVKLLTQTLQLVYSSEVLVFAEYAEFVSAVIYGLFTLIVYHMPYAQFSFRFIGLSSEDFWASVVNCAIYAVLEGLTLVSFCALARKKFGISTLYQLAFVLEKYWMSVQGKLVGSFVLVFILHTVHQGTDLTFTFDWEHILHAH